MIIEQTNELREMCLLHTLVYMNLIWVRIPWHQIKLLLRFDTGRPGLWQPFKAELQELDLSQ